MTWGTMSGYADPVVWLDAFYAAYHAANGNRDPQIDYLAFHWYDYGLDAQLNRLTKYGKPFWVTEFANWHSQQDGAQITTLAEQEMRVAFWIDNNHIVFVEWKGGLAFRDFRTAEAKIIDYGAIDRLAGIF